VNPFIIHIYFIIVVLELSCGTTSSYGSGLEIDNLGETDL